MKKFIKTNIKLFIIVIISALIFVGIGAYAISASEITYNNTTVEEALNYLYQMKDGQCDNSLIGTIWDYDYRNREDVFSVPCNGVYKLEAWGAQGGNNGGYGAYAKGEVTLTSGQLLFINVGGEGKTTSESQNQTALGGYNGGGKGHNYDSGTGRIAGSGGGATHIALTRGLLSTLGDKLDKVLIVSGGGGGKWSLSSEYLTQTIGHAGGIIGNQSVGYRAGTKYYADGGQQLTYGEKGTLKGSFGQGANYDDGTISSSGGQIPGGGGGLYGGNIDIFAAGGGSSYIGNNKLSNKAIYCYNCTEDDNTSTKAIKITTANGTPTSNTAKSGSGAVRITLISLN